MRKKEFKNKSEICQKPIWVKKSYDVSEFKGQEIELEIRYTTDGGYTEFGIIVDNIKLGEDLIDFENNQRLSGFKLLENGEEELFFNQFYLFEYRDPSDKFELNNKALSYNMDNNIFIGSQSMFVDQGNDLLEKFRMVKFDYQSGVVAWYFNSKYNRSENSPAIQEGKGYLLVLNSKVKEVKLPGILSSEDLFDKNGHYVKESPVYKAFEKSQRDMYVCFSHIDYATYQNGKAPDCGSYTYKDKMKSLLFGDKKLIYSREGFNELLPINQYGYYGVGKPLKSNQVLRTGLSTFRPKASSSFKPFKVYKSINDEMVLDEELTNSAESFEPVSEFYDKDSKLTENKRFHGDTAIVEKQGFGFKVLAPSKRIINLYSKSSKGSENDNYLRRPRAKLQLVWE